MYMFLIIKWQRGLRSVYQALAEQMICVISKACYWLFFFFFWYLFCFIWQYNKLRVEWPGGEMEITNSKCPGLYSNPGCCCKDSALIRGTHCAKWATRAPHGRWNISSDVWMFTILQWMQIFLFKTNQQFFFYTKEEKEKNMLCQ